MLNLRGESRVATLEMRWRQYRPKALSGCRLRWDEANGLRVVTELGLACPTGSAVKRTTSSTLSRPSPARRRWTWRRRATDLPDRRQGRTPVNPCRKNIQLFRNSDLPYSRFRSAPEQGASRDRRGRGAECGGRVSAVRRAASTRTDEVVWFWRAQARRQAVVWL